MDISLIILNIFNFFFIVPITYYAWLIGKAIGFSLPWKFISLGFVFAIIGTVIRILAYIFSITYSLLIDSGVALNVISYIFILIGFISIYKTLIGVPKK